MTYGPPAHASVVIPCYNQARFLAEAIESVLSQTHAGAEVIVVDDGSTDNPASITNQFPQVKLIRQENKGLSAARNTGWRDSSGDIVIFLDADDRLRPHAIELGAAFLQAHPECAFAAGGYQKITEEGDLLGPPILSKVRRDHYREFLKTNFIGMHAAVAYRRSILEEFGGFDESLRACEDYDLYLRIALLHPIYCHDHIIAEYRHHGSNMSRNPEFMLHWALLTLERQRRHLGGDDALTNAMVEGRWWWRWFYGEALYHSWKARLRGRKIGPEFARQLFVLLRNRPWLTERIKGVMSLCRFRLMRSWPPLGRPGFGDFRQTQPISEGTAQGIAQYYSSAFLKRWSNESEEMDLSAAICKSSTGQIMVRDLTSLQQFVPEAFDCVILPLSLHRAFDPREVIRSAHRILAPGGVLLATLPGIACTEREGDFWRYTALSAERLVQEESWAEIDVQAYGNVLTAVAQLHGIAPKDLDQGELDSSDAEYQVVIGVRAVRDPRP